MTTHGKGESLITGHNPGRVRPRRPSPNHLGLLNLCSVFPCLLDDLDPRFTTLGCPEPILPEILLTPAYEDATPASQYGVPRYLPYLGYVRSVPRSRFSVTHEAAYAAHIGVAPQAYSSYLLLLVWHPCLNPDVG